MPDETLTKEPARGAKLTVYCVGAGMLFLFVFLAYAFVVMRTGVEVWAMRQTILWERTKAAAIAQGDDFSLDSIVKIGVPDSENVAASPIFAKFYDDPDSSHADAFDPREYEALDVAMVRPEAPYGAWIGQVRPLTELMIDPPSSEREAAKAILSELSIVENLAEELKLAVSRPAFAPPREIGDNPYAMTLPELSALTDSAKFFRLRSRCFIELGEGELAVDDIETVIRLAERISQEPVLIAQLVASTLVGLLEESIWAGLKEHRFSESDCSRLAKALASIEWEERTVAALISERNLAIAGAEWLEAEVHSASLSDLWSSRDPTGFAKVLEPTTVAGVTDHNCLVIYQLMSEIWTAGEDGAFGGQLNDKFDQVEASFDEARTSPLLSVTAAYALMAMPAYVTIMKRIVDHEDRTELTRVALMIEQYRLRNGQIPDSLHELVPEFLDALPVDGFHHQALRYDRPIEGGFRLYFVGPDGVDDGGLPLRDRESGDTVWRTERIADFGWPEYKR